MHGTFRPSPMADVPPAGQMLSDVKNPGIISGKQQKDSRKHPLCVDSSANGTADTKNVHYYAGQPPIISPKRPNALGVDYNASPGEGRLISSSSSNLHKRTSADTAGYTPIQR